MTSDEFDRWIESHANVFGEGCIRYLGTADAAQAWYRILGGCNVTDATAATQALFAGELGEWHAWHEHPRLLLRHCQTKAAERRRMAIAREPNYRDAHQCLECNDTGYVEIFHPVFEEAIRKGQKNPHPYTGAIACNCRLGKSKLRGRERSFDEKTDFRVRGWRPIAPQVEAFMEWLGSNQQQPANRFKEFDAYSGAAPTRQDVFNSMSEVGKLPEQP